MRKLAIMISIGALALGFAANSASAATTKWVNQATGSDANDGDSAATAYKTLQFAIDNSASGAVGTPSIINVEDGIYPGTSGQSACPAYTAATLVSGHDYLTIQAVAGAEPSIKAAFFSTSMSIENSNHILIDNIDLDGSLSGFDRMHVCGSSDVAVVNSVISDGEDGIDVESSHTGFLIQNNVFAALTEDAVDFSDGAYSDTTIQDNRFDADNRRPILIRKFGTDPIGDFVIQRNLSLGTIPGADVGQEAFRVIGADDVLIQNNVIMNSNQQGIYIDSGCSNITVQHNTLFNNDQEGIGQGELRTKSLTSDIVIKNNILNGNGSNPAIETTAASLPGEDYNLTFSTVDTLTFGTNTLTGMDPLFVSTTAGSEDLSLTAGSPAIEAGADLGVTDDVTKGSRPLPAGTNPDIGAYEFEPPAPSYSCDGFEAPMNLALLPGPFGGGEIGRTVKRNRVLPFKATLVDGDGNPVTDLIAPPVIDVSFDPTIGPTEDVTDDALTPGKRNEGNQFVLAGDKWTFNLWTKNYTADGRYTVTMQSGDAGEYTIDPICRGLFVIEP